MDSNHGWTVWLNRGGGFELVGREQVGGMTLADALAAALALYARLFPFLPPRNWTRTSGIFLRSGYAYYPYRPPTASGLAAVR